MGIPFLSMPSFSGSPFLGAFGIYHLLYSYATCSGWNLRCMDSGNLFHFVGADSSCISWGHAQNGELGYGPDAQK